VWFCLKLCGSGRRKQNSGRRKILEYVKAAELSARTAALKLFVVLDQGKNVEALEFGAAFQES
jgi:hypothetical protein